LNLQNERPAEYAAPSRPRIRVSSRRNRLFAICFCALWLSVVSLSAQTPVVSFAGVHADLPNKGPNGVPLSPNAISVNGAGNIFISQLPSNGMARLSPGGGFETQLLPPFWSVRSLTADRSGNVWVSAFSNDGSGLVNHLVKIDLTGAITEINAAGPIPVVTTDLSGNVYYSAPGGSTNVIPSGTVIPQLFSIYSSAVAMAVDQAGNLFYMDGSTVMKAPLGCYSPACSPQGPPPIPPAVPVFNSDSFFAALALDRFGNLFVGSSTETVYELPAGCAGESCTIRFSQQDFIRDGGFAVNPNGDIFTSLIGTDVLAIQFRSADFYDVPVRSSHTLTLNFTINSAVTPGANPGVLTQGVSGLDFALSSSTCSGFQAAGGACTVSVSFSPQAPGLRMGSVQLKDSAGNTLVNVPLPGVGTGPAVAFASGPQTMLTQSVASDVAMDAAGNVFITDTSAKAVLKIPAGCTGSACQTTVATGLVDPLKLAVDGAGALFVADTGANRIVKIPAGCTTTACQTTVGSGLLQPDGVALDGWGNVYISDFGHQRIVVARDNCTGPFCQATVISGVDSPEGLALSTPGDLLIAQANKNQVSLYTAGCTTTSCSTTLGTGLLFPAGVAFTAGRAALMTNPGSNQVIEIPWNCKTSACQSTIGSGSGPFGVTVDSVGNVFVAYAGGHEVDKISRTVAPTVALPTTFVSHKSNSQTVTLENIGNDRLDFSGFSASANFGVDPGTTTCQSFLRPGASCSIGVYCAPLTGGSLTGTLTISDTALNQNGFNQNATQSVPLTCTATGSQPQVSFTGAPAAAPFDSTFTVLATTNAAA
jgi:streptogramin lyase